MNIITNTLTADMGSTVEGNGSEWSGKHPGALDLLGVDGDPQPGVRMSLSGARNRDSVD